MEICFVQLSSVGFIAPPKMKEKYLLPEESNLTETGARCLLNNSLSETLHERTLTSLPSLAFCSVATQLFTPFLLILFSSVASVLSPLRIETCGSKVPMDKLIQEVYVNH
ncbi:hypothetical protein CBL_09383 [Carabus blaptoides fortunei]